MFKDISFSSECTFYKCRVTTSDQIDVFLLAVITFYACSGVTHTAFINASSCNINMYFTARFHCDTSAGVGHFNVAALHELIMKILDEIEK